MAKSPSSWASRHFLLGQCDALIAVSEFVAKVLREGAYEPDSPEAERRVRPPLRGDHAKIHVIHGGIDPAKFRPADAAEKGASWACSRGIMPSRWWADLICRAARGSANFWPPPRAFTKKFPHARFLIIGRGSMAETLQADIARWVWTAKRG